MSSIKKDSPAASSFIAYASPEDGGATATSMSLGEEGGSKEPARKEPRLTSMSLGEESGTRTRSPEPRLTSFALGEESGTRQPTASTEAVGEEGGGIQRPKRPALPKTVAEVTSLRTSEIPIEAAVSSIKEKLSSDPLVRQTLSVDKIAELTEALVAFANRDESTEAIISKFIAENGAKPQSPLSTR